LGRIWTLNLFRSEQVRNRHVPSRGEIAGAGHCTTVPLWPDGIELGCVRVGPRWMRYLARDEKNQLIGKPGELGRTC
jgi:hypothetical protein